MSVTHNAILDDYLQPTFNETFMKSVVDRIVNKFHPRRVILFGSHATGQSRPHSDIDLFIEMESELTPARRSQAVAEALGEDDWMFDIIVYTPEEFQATKQIIGMLPYIVEQEGKVLYERP